MVSQFSSIACGLVSSASWGIGDFIGGFATKRMPSHLVIVFSQVVRVLLLLGAALFTSEMLPPVNDMIYGGLGGVASAFGLTALYRGLASGRMGIVAPVAAVMTALVSVVVGAVREGLPPLTQFIGFAVAILAVWSLSRGKGAESGSASGLALALAGGLGLGFLYVFLDMASIRSVLWPLVSARICSITLLSLLAVPGRRWSLPGRRQLLPIALVGLFNAGGDGFFLPGGAGWAARRSGRAVVSLPSDDRADGTPSSQGKIAPFAVDRRVCRPAGPRHDLPLKY